MKSIKVNDVVFVCIENKLSILPARITEKIIKEKVDGIFVEYYLYLPNAATVKVDGDTDLFNTIEEAKAYIMNKVENSLNAMCKKSIALVKNVTVAIRHQESVQTAEELDYNPISGEAAHEESISSTNHLFAGMIPTEITLPDGTIAKVKPAAQ
jgi:hypothetical protein